MEKKKRSPTRRTTVAAPSWKYIAFGDLHVKAASLARCLDVLARVRALTIKHGAEVVCMGDFWDQRGVLSVRQLDAILTELEAHKAAGVRWKLIPGNHDQVTRDGLIHGLRVFEQFPNIEVVTEPLIDKALGVAFIPWREDSAEQTKMFADIPEGFTAFGHGEIKGALANNGHKADGKFTVKMVRHLKAVYLSHYHQRQQIGNTVYVGSPYEQSMGERNMPHGVALVSSHDETSYFDFDDLPKHWRLTWPNDKKMFGLVRPQDIVEVLAPKAELHSPAFTKALGKIEANDIRPLPLSVSTEKGAPTFALTLNEALVRYAMENAGKLSPTELEQYGRNILGDVADAHAIVPLGNLIRVKSATIEGFCTVRDRVTLNLDRQGSCLFRGPMGVGKTALTDAVTWCLYGVTAPRKAGSSGATLAADKVINDFAASVEVSTALMIDDDPAEYLVTRTKKRGSGSKVEITKDGKPWESTGISDMQDLVHRLIGLPYELWRTCVSLGQGEVQHFVTDAQKKRTELLERAFQLQPCVPAQALVRKKRKELEARIKPLHERLVDIRARRAQLDEANYERESEGWERTRRFQIDEHQTVALTAKDDVKTCDDNLVHEAAWQERKARLLASQADFTARLRKVDIKPKVGKMHADLGAANAELSMTRMALNTLNKSYQEAQRGGLCSECGQAIPRERHEEHLEEMETKIRSKQVEISSIEARVSNLQVELGRVSVEGLPDLSGITSQLEEVGRGIVAADLALDAIAKIKERKKSSEQVYQQALRSIDVLKKSENPWASKIAEQAAQREKFNNAEQTTGTALNVLEHEEAFLRFWDDGFGPKGIPVLVLRTALHELEMYANSFLSRILGGKVFTELAMDGDDLDIRFFEYDPEGTMRQRDYLQLSGGQRRCVQLAFAPFALSEMIFNRTGVRIPFLVIDELTTHLDADTKPLVCAVLRELDRETIVVIDHDPQVQGEFDVVYEVSANGNIRRA